VLSRLKGVDLKTNAPVREAVMRLLEKPHGTLNFVKIVRDFHIEGQDAELLKMRGDPTRGAETFA